MTELGAGLPEAGCGAGGSAHPWGLTAQHSLAPDGAVLPSRLPGLTTAIRS